MSNPTSSAAAVTTPSPSPAAPAVSPNVHKKAGDGGKITKSSSGTKSVSKSSKSSRAEDPVSPQHEPFETDDGLEDLPEAHAITAAASVAAVSKPVDDPVRRSTIQTVEELQTFLPSIASGLEDLPTWQLDIGKYLDCLGKTRQMQELGFGNLFACASLSKGSEVYWLTPFGAVMANGTLEQVGQFLTSFGHLLSNPDFVGYHRSGSARLPSIVSPIFLAVQLKKPELMRLLISSGKFNINVGFSTPHLGKSVTPLFHAIQLKQFEMARDLISHPACNVNLGEEEGGQGMSIFFMTAVASGDNKPASGSESFSEAQREELLTLLPLMATHETRDREVKYNQTPVHEYLSKLFPPLAHLIEAAPLPPVSNFAAKFSELYESADTWGDSFSSSSVYASSSRSNDQSFSHVYASHNESGGGGDFARMLAMA